MKCFLSVSVFLLTSLLGLMAADPVMLTGANGREVAFAGVRQAGPMGLTLMMEEDSDEITVGWDKFDLEALKKHPKIYAAYQSAQNGRTTALNLGLYEDMLTQQQYLANLRQAMKEEDRYEVPKLSDFFSHKDDDLSFTSTSKSQDSNAAKRSKRFVDTYRELLDEFFLLAKESLKTDTITWDWGNGDRYVIVKEAYPSSGSVKLSRMHVIEFFANEKNRSRNKAAEYFNARPGQLDPIIQMLRKFKRQAQSQLMADETTRYRYVYLLDSVEEHLQGFRESQTLPDSVERDLQNFIREMELRSPR